MKINSQTHENTNDNRLKILFLPAWYPSASSPIEGIFVREHAKATSIYNDVTVLYAVCASSSNHILENRVSSDWTEDSIRTIRIEYGGLQKLLKRIFRISKAKKTSLGTSTTRSIRTPKLLITLYDIIINFQYYWAVFMAFNRLVKSGWRPNIIHAHVYSAGVPAVIIGRLFRIPVIITEHYSGILLHSLDNLEKMKLRFAMNSAEKVLPVSKILEESLQNYYCIKTKAFVVPNTVDVKRFATPSKLHTQKRKIQLLTVCSLIPTKGVNYLLEALNKIKQTRQDFFLNIIGDGPLRNEYELLNIKLGLNSVVKFHGRQSNIEEFMGKCDFFVLPSFYETFGVVYIEAMSCGKPVIATNSGGPSEIVKKDVGILVPPKNVEALKEAIEYMLDNYQAYSSEKIARYAQENFSHEVVGMILDKIYRETLFDYKGEG